MPSVSQVMDAHNNQHDLKENTIVRPSTLFESHNKSNELYIVTP